MDEFHSSQNQLSAGKALLLLDSDPFIRSGMTGIQHTDFWRVLMECISPDALGLALYRHSRAILKFLTSRCLRKDTVIDRVLNERFRLVDQSLNQESSLSSCLALGEKNVFFNAR